MKMRFHLKRRGRLSYAQRKHLTPGSFAIPPGPSNNYKGKYPIDTANRARNALARVSHYGTQSEKSKVCSAVHKHYPEIHSEFCRLH